VLQNVFLSELDVIAFVLAYDYVEFTAGIGQNGSAVHALNPFQ
jgi:hypothetical protein